MQAVAVVIGLHCCGGLSEASVELAAECNAAAGFCVCTCCFCSNPELATLTNKVTTKTLPTACVFTAFLR